MSISWRFVGKRCLRLSSLSLSLCTAVWLPNCLYSCFCSCLLFSAQQILSLLCPEFSSSFYLTPRKSQGFIWATPPPSSGCSDLPDTISSYFQPPTHAHTHICIHAHTGTHTHARCSWNLPDALLSRPPHFICCFLLCPSQTLAWLTFFLPQVFS